MSYIDNHQDQAFGRIITQYKFDVIIPPPPPPPPTDLRFLPVGHSYVYGIIPSGDLGVPGNSYRREMYYRWRTLYNMEYDFVGSFANGDFPSPYHNGVSGEDSDGLNSLIDGYLDAAFPSPTTSDCVLMGPIGFADCLNSVPHSVFRSNIISIVNKIDAHSPKIKIFLISDPDIPFTGFPLGQDINDYADEIRNAYDIVLANGKNVYLIDLNTQAIHIGLDDIHPNWLGYEQKGEYLTDQVAALLNIPINSTSIYLEDTFTDTNGVLLKNHTPDINNTGNVWLDPNDRFNINNNELRGIGGYAFDSQIDINKVVYACRIKMRQSNDGSVFFVIKSNSGGSTRLYLWLNSGAGELTINGNGSLYFKASFPNSLNTWYTFNIIIGGNSIRISDINDVEIIHTVLTATYNNLTYLGFSYFPPSLNDFDDLMVANKIVT